MSDRSGERGQAIRSATALFGTISAALCFWSFGYTVMRASDLWWHLAAGRWIVDHRSIPPVDAWSYTREGAPWIHHEWLSDVIFDLYARLFGREALVFWKWGLIAGTFTILFVVLRRKTQGAAASFLAAFAAAAAAQPFLDIRPHLYTFLGVVLLIGLVLGRERPSWAVPTLFLVWANLHGGFFFGLLALGALLVPHLLFGDRAARIRAASIAAASTLAAFVNPNGIRAFTYPLKYAFDRSSPFRELGEWRPPFEAGGIPTPAYPVVLGLFAAAVVVCLAVRALRRDRAWLVAALAMGALTLAMSLTSRRFVPLFGIAQALVSAPALAHVLSPLTRFLPSLVTPALFLGVALFRLAPYPLGPRAFTYLTVEEGFPVDTCNFMEANRLQGKVFAYYNWGGYLHMRSAGRLKVYIDGRADTVFDDETYRRYLRVLNHEPGYLDVLESSGAEFVLWDRRGDRALGDQLVATGRWRQLYGDSVSVLLVRDGVPVPDPLVEPADSAWHEIKLGDDLYRSGNLAGAEERFRCALSMPPRPRSACSGLARAQMRAGASDEAWRTVRECERLFPSPELIESLRRLQRSRGVGD